MKQTTQTLLLVCGSLLLLVSFTATVRAQETYVVGSIRWNKEMGVVPLGPAHNQPALSPCSIFSVAALDAQTQEPVAYTRQLDEPFSRADDETHYVCKYSLKVPENRGLYIMATMGGVLLLPKEDRSPYLITGAWIGGSRSKPPAGYERGFTGYKWVTLRSLSKIKKTVWSVNFEMIYISTGPK